MGVAIAIAQDILTFPGVSRTNYLNPEPFYDFEGGVEMATNPRSPEPPRHESPIALVEKLARDGI